MIHDPLRARSRGMVFGAVAVLFGCMGAGLMAWVNPNENPGDSNIVRAADGELFVRVDEVLHPVTNMTSARLVVGTPEEASPIGADALAAATQGVPLGISPAPGLVAVEPEEKPFALCQTPERELIVVRGAIRALSEDDVDLVSDPWGTQWALTTQGRHRLPPADTPEGRVLRRALGADEATRDVDGEMLTAITELPAWRLPDQLPEVADNLAVTPENTVVTLTPFQAHMLIDAGSPISTRPRATLAELPDSPAYSLPTRELVPRTDEERWLCAGPDGKVGTREPIEVVTQLGGDHPADGFVSGGMAAPLVIDTGHGFHIISPHGMRHETTPEALEALGADHAHPARWEIIGLLPEGPAVNRESALTPVY